MIKLRLNLVGISLVLCVGAAFAQIPTVSISSPLPGTVLTPGQIVTISVQSSPQGAFQLISVVGQSPLGIFNANGQDSPNFSLTVPRTISAGTYGLTAVAVDRDGNRLMSRPVIVRIESASPAPTMLFSDLKYIDFTYVGQTFPLFASVRESDDFDVSKSPELRWEVFASPATVRGARVEALPPVPIPSNVAVVTPGGVAIARQSGLAVIRGTYRGASVLIPISVVASRRGDLDGDGDVDSDDLGKILDSVGVTPSGTWDARDLNADGKINALDTRILTTLCSRLRCATF